MIKIEFNQGLQLEELLTLYKTADFATEKLTDDLTRLQTMVDHTPLIVTLRENERLIGMARCLTDFEYSCYLSEIVVLSAYRGRRMGKLILQSIENYLGCRVAINLRADPSAIGFYSKVGYEPVDNMFRIHREG
ncbi:GNAT family N-acetyltransferase [uncultured Secundilactobacillus sp.]|uniref:GNAT family N-acetyltransferase n=1 Tax=uncultured Secundilactobacillus sp. TaxID=2813935 RepID=UPI0025877B52|nr:GNAT family N-acetyltransferase [uncultured Secundilactobacillus sp.]